MSAHSDQPTDIDHLGVESHAVALAGYLSAKSTQTPLTVSIEAPWGMGKSTFLKLVRKSLMSANTKPHVIWFNPWRHDAGEALWAAFLYEFADQVEKGTPFCAKQWARACFYGQAMKDRLIPKSLWFILIISIILASYFWLKPYLDQTQIALSWLFPTLLTAATVVAPELNKFFLGLKLDVAKVWKKDDEKARVCAAEKASGHFRAFLKANLRADERIYVIIDDLDRCAAPKAAELLDSLQLLISGNGDDMENFPVIFLLAMDREKVAAGVAVKFEKLLPYVGEGMPSEYKDKVHAGREFGYEYLQKFIDVPFRLPGAGPIGMERYITGLAGHQTSYPPLQKTTPAGTPPQQPSPEPATSQTKIPTSSFKRAITLPLTKSVERVQEATREQFKKLDLTAALAMAAPLLGNNPRRVKQYLNLLRLRVAIAEATDLFSQDVKITHLAKLVVVELARPVIYRRLCEEPKLRSDLEKAMSLDGTAFGIFAKEGEENPTLQELKKSLNQSDLEWFKAHLDSLNQSLEKTKTQDPFPTALLMDRIFHLTSPPGEIEARIVTEMK